MRVPYLMQALFSAGHIATTTTTSISGSSYAGSTSSAVYPPPNATITQYSSFFPGATEVGFAGATPTGDHPEALATAAAAEKGDVYPLTRPPTLSNKGSEGSSTFNPMRSWGNLSPWFSVDSGDNGLPDASPQVPDGCELTQVHLLHRHGARYPTTADAPAQFAAALHQVASTTGFSVSGPLKFLSNWTYKLGADLLLPFGRQQLFENGVSFRIRYGKLLDKFQGIPVIRTTSQARMVDSAVSFSAGFFGVQEYRDQAHLSIAVESPGKNTTLASYMNCPNMFRNAGAANSALAQWGPVYLNKAIDRLQKYISGVQLNYTHVHAMQELCAYETVALGYSEFCGLFTEEEWRGFEYLLDLSFWYLGGPGDPTASAQGIGYVQELVARLTKTPLTSFNTSTNKTLNGNNITFPLDQPMYIDFTHDLTIATILTAMNISTGHFASQGPLPVTHIPANLTYRLQHMLPFAANLVGQVLTCPASQANPTPVPFIRWILNDGVVPLTGIKQCAKHSDENGLCPLGRFVDGMRELIEDTDWKYGCIGNWTIPGVPNAIVDGKPPAASKPPCPV